CADGANGCGIGDHLSMSSTSNEIRVTAARAPAGPLDPLLARRPAGAVLGGCRDRGVLEPLDVVQAPGRLAHGPGWIVGATLTGALASPDRSSRTGDLATIEGGRPRSAGIAAVASA